MVVLAAMSPELAALTEPPSVVVWAPPPPVRFASGSARVMKEDRRFLAAWATMARAKPRVRLSITGYCDERGSAADNRALSMRRAVAVQRALAELGVSESQMSVRAGGETGGGASARRADIQVSVRGPVTFRAIPFGGKARVRLVIYNLPDDAPRTLRLRVPARGAVVSQLAPPGRIGIADVAALLGVRGTADLEVSVSPGEGGWPVVAIGEGETRVVRLP